MSVQGMCVVCGILNYIHTGVGMPEFREYFLCVFMCGVREKRCVWYDVSVCSMCSCVWSVVVLCMWKACRLP